MADPILATQSLSKEFGGLVAVDQVSLNFTAGTVHAVIGPNGAGKTTLINLLSGELRPSSGRIHFQGREITGAPSNRTARLGIGRSYQKTNIFPEFSCLQNCWIGAQMRLPTSMRFFRAARRYRAVAERAERALALCELAHRKDVPAAEISYGEQRQLEIGMMLATEPTLLLLDEPLAGMGIDESARVSVGAWMRTAATRIASGGIRVIAASPTTPGHGLSSRRQSAIPVQATADGSDVRADARHGCGVSRAFSPSTSCRRDPCRRRPSRRRSAAS